MFFTHMRTLRRVFFIIILHLERHYFHKTVINNFLVILNILRQYFLNMSISNYFFNKCKTLKSNFGTLNEDGRVGYLRNLHF